MPDLLIFDLDGTLIDSRRDLAISTNAALRAVGLPERPELEIQGFVGWGARRLIEQAVAPRQDRYAITRAAWEEHYAMHLLDHTALYPGFAELLDRLDGVLAVHTNKPGAFARQILDGLGLSQRFTRVHGGGDGSPHKPDPTGARWILSELATPPERAIYIGDSHVDAATARAAGIPFVGAAWGFGGERELREAGADQIAQDPAALEPFLRRA
jgi:phosphoglycolate phosphatase